MPTGTAQSSVTRLFLTFRRTGDTDVLERCLRTVAPILLQDARRLRFDRNDSADLLQETLLTAIERCRTFTPNAELLPWLRGILHNHARTRRRRERRFTALPDSEALVSHDRSPEEPISSQQMADLVRGAVASLPSPYREVMTIYLEGVTSPNRIAERLDRSPSTVRSQLTRGLDKLRNKVPPSAAPFVVVLCVVHRARSQDVPDLSTSDWNARHLLFALGAVAGVVALTLTSSRPKDEASAPVLDQANSRTTEREPRTLERRPPPSRVGRQLPSNPRTLHVRVRFRDDSSAAGLPILVEPTANAELSPTQRALANTMGDTDANGVARFPNLSHESVLVRVDDRSVLRTVALDRDGPTTIELELAAPAQLHGRVVDPRGRPERNARVWLSASDGSTPGYRAATTDENGKFRASLFGSNATIWAVTARGHKSIRHQVVAGARSSIELRTTPTNATIRGRVVCPSGESIDGAIVAVYAKPGCRLPASFGHSDSKGRFEISGLGHGEHTVVAFGAGRSPTGRRVTPRDEPIEITLSAGCRVQGRIHGIPAAMLVNSRVRCLPGPSKDIHATASLPWGRPDHAGAFSMDSLPAGASVLEVFECDHPAVVLARCRIRLVAGGRAHVVITATDVRERHIQVVDHTGEPCPGVQLELYDPGPRWKSRRARARITADDRGRARLPGLDRRRFRVLAWPAGATRQVAFPAATQTIDLKSEKLCLRLPQHFGQSFDVSGEIDWEALDRYGLGLVLIQRGSGTARAAEREDGAFAFHELPIASYVIAARRVGPPAWSTTHLRDLRVSRDADLGRIALPSFGWLELSSDDLQRARIIDSAGKQLGRARLAKGRPVLVALPAAKYRIRSGLRDAPPTVVEVRPGEHQRVRIRPRRRRTVYLRFEPNDYTVSQGDITLLRVSVTDLATGTKQRSKSSRFRGGRWRHAVQLPPGRYRVQARGGRVQFERKIEVPPGYGDLTFTIVPVR